MYMNVEYVLVQFYVRIGINKTLYYSLSLMIYLRVHRFFFFQIKRMSFCFGLLHEVVGDSRLNNYFWPLYG